LRIAQGIFSEIIFPSLCLLDDLDRRLLPFGNWEGGAVFTGESLLQALMGRYPRHYWPDDPRAARSTAQAKKKKHFF